MSKIKAETWENLDGTENYKCRAWVNFDGTTTPPTIRASGNVSSVVRNGTGDFTVNFTEGMPDANYSLTTSGNTSSTAHISIDQGTELARTAALIRLRSKRNDTSANIDLNFANVAIFR